MPVRIVCVAGARPNFVKIASIMRALRAEPAFSATLVHTGQHYDDALSKVFFHDLAIPQPEIELEVGSAGHAAQTAEIMKRFEPVLAKVQPHAVLVVGDVNSTIACALVTAKFVLAEPFIYAGAPRVRPVMIHVEAGLRSQDWDMPEEINRILTDRISDLLFVSDPAGMDNLRAEGTPESRIHYVGNVMIDTLLSVKQRALQSDVLARLGGLEESTYGLVTLHRPSNVDDPRELGDRLATLDAIARELRLVFPVHPRTRARIASAGVTLDPERWIVTDPVGYLDFVKLMACARVVLTDSGGIQEETTILGVPCVTMRENTERPVTIHEGTNVLGGTSRDGVMAAYRTAMANAGRDRVPRGWDGRTAERILGVLRDVLSEAR
jgi:UDP-N-acetylglucosamine 2-epimerase (non-hydrolysing)